MVSILVTKDSKGKFRMLRFSLTALPAGHYLIKRESGLVGGKLTQQPDILITEGKVKRTIEEQALLKYNSLIKSQLDKGYKQIDENIDLNPDSLAKIMPENVTDQNGIAKPMLCKVFDPSDKRNNQTTWFISRKLDGTRCFLYFKDEEIHTKSRGGKDYDIATKYIREDPEIINLFKQNPNLILDGEIYRHGWPLSKISGLCRLETNNEEHKELKFYCYDIADETLTFTERLSFLSSLNLSSDKLIITEHIKTTVSDMDKYHDTFVSEGYEGAVVRDGEAKYKFGARDRRMMKIKKFQDAEFLIKDLVEGLRDEDLCFLMETKEGYEFKAKPIGDRELKNWYRENINNIRGKKGTVKFFGYTTTDKPVPNLPVFKCIYEN